MRFGERRLTGAQVSELPLSLVEVGLRGSNGVLGSSSPLAGLPFGKARGLKVGVQHLDISSRRIALAAQFGDLGIEFSKAIALCEALGRRTWRIGGRNQSVPAPHGAIKRHQTLTGLERMQQAWTIRRVDQADLVKPALKERRSRDIAGHRLGGLGQGRVVPVIHWRRPVERRASVGTGFKVIPQRRAERCFIAWCNVDLIGDCRPEARAIIEHLAQGAGLAFQPAESRFDPGKQRTRSIELALRCGSSSFSRKRFRFRHGTGRPRAFQSVALRQKRLIAVEPLLGLPALPLDLSDLGFEAPQTRRRLAEAAHGLAATSPHLCQAVRRKPCRSFSCRHRLTRRLKRRLRFGHGALSRSCLTLKAQLFCADGRQRRVSLPNQFAFTHAVRGQLA